MYVVYKVLGKNNSFLLGPKIAINSQNSMIQNIMSGQVNDNF